MPKTDVCMAVWCVNDDRWMTENCGGVWIELGHLLSFWHSSHTSVTNARHPSEACVTCTNKHLAVIQSSIHRHCPRKTQHIYIYLPSYSTHSHNRNSNKKFETFIFIKRNTANSMMLDAIIIKHCPVCVTYNKIAYPSVDRAGCSIYAIVRWILCFQLAIIVAV